MGTLASQLSLGHMMGVTLIVMKGWGVLSGVVRMALTSDCQVRI